MDFDILQDRLGKPHEAQHDRKETSLLSHSPSRLIQRQLNSPPLMTHVQHIDISQPSPKANSHAGAVITKLEDIFESLLDCLIDEKKGLVLHLKSRGKLVQQTLDPVTGTIRNIGTAEAKEIGFPGKTQREAWKFAALLRIMELSHEALVTGIVTTKRDIYYRDPELFVKQAVVDRYIDDLAFTLNIPRDSLNIVATAKGLISGSLLVHKYDGQIIDCDTENEGVLVPNIKDIERLSFPSTQWILIIEKEATFRTLSTSHHASTSLAGPGLLITAKGYPDIATRSLVHLLASTPGCPPIYALSDHDPHGLSILSTYAHGSASLAHQNETLAVPDIRWLGVKMDDVIDTQRRQHGGGGSDAAGILTLTKRDRRLARSMLGTNPAFEESVHSDWRRELQCMLFLNVKAEIQILGGSDSLGRWVETRIGGWNEDHLDE